MSGIARSTGSDLRVILCGGLLMQTKKEASVRETERCVSDGE